MYPPTKYPERFHSTISVSQPLGHSYSPTESLAKIDDEKRSPEDVDLKSRFPTVDERKLMRKIDLRLVPVLCVLYLLAFLDRSVVST